MLIARPRPIEHEHILSYLVRLTQMNGYQSVVQLLKACKRPTPNNRIPATGLLFGGSSTSYICESCRITQDMLNQHVFTRAAKGFCKFEDIMLPIGALSTHHFEFCPQCWAELGYVPFYQLLKPYTFCHVHHKALVDQDDANKPLIWGNRNLGLILENLSVRLLSDTDISSSAQRLSETIGILSSDKNDEIMIAGTPFNLHNFLLLLIFLHRFAARRFKQLAINQTSSNLTCSEVYGAIFQFVEDWPDGFYALLKYFENNPMSQRGRSGIRHCFRDLYDELYTGTYRKTQCYYFIRDWFERYINQQFNQSALNTSIKWLTNPVTRQLYQKQALQILNWPPSRLKLYERHGLIRTTSQPQTGKSLYSNTDIKSLKKQAQNHLTLSESAELLQVSNYQARKLLIAGQLEAIASPDNATRDWIVDKLSLNRLIKELKSSAEKSEPEQFSEVSLKQLMLRGYDLSMAINLVLKNKLVATYRCDSERPYSIKQFAFFHNKQMLPEGYLTPKQAAARLGININAIYDFLKLGYLCQEPHKIERTTRLVKLIPATSLNFFKSKYALSRELTKEQKRSLRLISGPDIDGATVKLYCRKKLSS